MRKTYSSSCCQCLCSYWIPVFARRPRIWLLPRSDAMSMRRSMQLPLASCPSTTDSSLPVCWYCTATLPCCLYCTALCCLVAYIARLYVALLPTLHSCTLPCCLHCTALCCPSFWKCNWARWEMHVRLLLHLPCHSFFASRTFAIFASHMFLTSLSSQTRRQGGSCMRRKCSPIVGGMQRTLLNSLCWTILVHKTR